MGKCFFHLSLIFLIKCGLFAEVQNVTVTWNSKVCNQQCASLLTNQLRNLKELDKGSSINGETGVASLKWKPNAPFSYVSIKTQFQMVGVGINELRVKVRGRARLQGEQVVLISEQDYTSFTLVSPLMPPPGQYMAYPNPVFRTLSGNLREEIIKAAGEGKILSIEGPLYEPWRSPPLQLVVEKIQIEKKPTQ